MALIDRSQFVGLEHVAHLCTGGEAPWLRSHDAACQHFGRLKSGGMAGRDEMFALYRRAKAGVAALLGVPPADVAFLAHASEGLNQAVAAVDWRAGDNAVFADLEYPSIAYPVAALAERGVEPRVVRTRDHYLSLDVLAAAVDARTRLVLVSQVSYLTGQRLDLARCADIARARGAWLAVDATHALGVAPVPGDLCDFVVSSCYKWLLGTHGVGIFAYSAERVGPLRPATVGWHSVDDRGGIASPLDVHLRGDAARLEAGNPSLLGLFVLVQRPCGAHAPRFEDDARPRARAGRRAHRGTAPARAPARHARGRGRARRQRVLPRGGWPWPGGAPGRARRPGLGRRRARAHLATRPQRRGRRAPLPGGARR